MTPEEPFEKTFRLVCRLDDADIDYVRDTSEWIRRCIARVGLCSGLPLDGNFGIDASIAPSANVSSLSALP